MGPALGQQTPHFWGKPTARLPLPLCPVLCSLKIQSILLVVPSSTPASERGRRRRGVIRNPDCSKKLHYKGALLRGGPSLFTLAAGGKLPLVQMAAGGEDEGEPPSSTTNPLERSSRLQRLGDPFPIQPRGYTPAKNRRRGRSGGRGSQSDCKGRQEKRKHCISPPFS